MIRASLRLLLPLLPLLLLPTRGAAQTIYALVLGNQKYVVGSSTLRSGLFASRDLGRSWTHLGPENLKAYSMDAVDSARGRILFIAAGNGVHRSTDGGATWKIVTDWRMTEVLDVMVDQRHPATVLAATAFGLWRSTDGGDSWSPAGSGRPDSTYCYRLARLAGDAGVALLTEDRLYVSRDGSFSTTEEIPFKRTRAILALGDAGAVLGGAIGPTLWTGPLLTGKASSGEGVGEPGATAAELARGCPRMQIYDLALTSRSEILAAGDGGIWRHDTTGGGGWTDLTDGLPDGTVHAVAPLADGGMLVGTFGEGIFRRDGEAWAPSGLEGSQIWRMVTKPW